MPIEGNDMELGEFQEWAEKGKSMRDAAFGLTFRACQLSVATKGQDTAIPILLEVAKVALLAEIAEKLGSLDYTYKHTYT